MSVRWELISCQSKDKQKDDEYAYNTSGTRGTQEKSASTSATLETSAQGLRNASIEWIDKANI